MISPKGIDKKNEKMLVLGMANWSGGRAPFKKIIKNCKEKKLQKGVNVRLGRCVPSCT